MTVSEESRRRSFFPTIIRDIETMMTSSVQFGLRKRQKIDVPPQAFSEESDEESNPQLSEGDVDAKVKQLQASKGEYV